MLERTEGKSGGRGRERAREEGGNTEGGEKVCDRGRENQKRKRESERGYHAEGRYGYQMQTEMCKEKKRSVFLNIQQVLVQSALI